jgi:hypothetical protein
MRIERRRSCLTAGTASGEGGANGVSRTASKQKRRGDARLAEEEEDGGCGEVPVQDAEEETPTVLL